ncbi:LOW QUALITY PROTEIN: hypothetical protein HJC23_004485 [Cyclotella cryptica]|uniref:Uncharacterized protein n=1 Tax=Cyclotella cryptica TaxID=29204 RepID=A0ABD3PRU5_9STRA
METPTAGSTAPSTAASDAPTAVNASAIVNAVVNNSAAANINGISDPESRDLHVGDNAESTATTNALKLNSTDDAEELDAPVSEETKKAAAEKRQQEKQKEKQAQQTCQLEMMKQTPLKNIQFTADRKTSSRLALFCGRMWSCSIGKNIKYGRSRSKDQLGGVIVEYMKALPYKNAVSTTRRISDAAATTRVSSTIQRGNGTVARKSAKPNFLTEGRDGTFYRDANVLRVQKECYVATKNAGIAHIVEWNTMLNAFNKYNPDLEIDCVQTYQELELFGIDPMYASVFDGPLNVEQFMQVVGYMEVQYADCCKRCKRSGQMENFIEYINGLLWLGYMRCTFMAVGDSSLHDTVFSELPVRVLNESTGGAPGPRQRGWSGSSRSTSPVPPGGSGKKYKASAAIQYAAKSLDTRMKTGLKTAMLVWHLRTNEAEEEMIELDDRLGTMKSMRKVMKRRGEPFADEAEYQRLKKKLKQLMPTKEVKRLEKLLGYDDKSTGDKSSSSSDDGETGFESA